MAPNHEHGTDPTTPKRHPARVEHRDHDDRSDVVDDREREHEELQRARNAGAERLRALRPRTRCRSPSGCPSRTPPAPPVFSSVLEQHRHEHAAQRHDPLEGRRRAGCAVRHLTSSRLISSPATKKKTLAASFMETQDSSGSFCGGDFPVVAGMFLLCERRGRRPEALDRALRREPCRPGAPPSWPCPRRAGAGPRSGSPRSPRPCGTSP